MSRMATVKETGVELSEDEWRRFEAGVAAELAVRTQQWTHAGPPESIPHASLSDAPGRAPGIRASQPGQSRTQP